MVRVVFDPHQSPIWFKAIVFLLLNNAPSAHGGPENHRCHAGSNWIFTDHVVMNQPLCGCRHRRIKIKNRMWVQQVPIRPAGLSPNPRMVLCCTQTDYRNNFSSSNATWSRMIKYVALVSLLAKAFVASTRLLLAILRWKNFWAFGQHRMAWLAASTYAQARYRFPFFFVFAFFLAIGSFLTFHASAIWRVIAGFRKPTNVTDFEHNG